MSLSAEDLGALQEMLGEPPVSPATIRARWPALSVTRCDASDMAEEPYRAWPHLALYLVDGSAHCVQLTNDPARATGVVLAATRQARG